MSFTTRPHDVLSLQVIYLSFHCQCKPGPGYLVHCAVTFAIPHTLTVSLRQIFPEYSAVISGLRMGICPIYFVPQYYPIYCVPHLTVLKSGFPCLWPWLHSNPLFSTGLTHPPSLPSHSTQHLLAKKVAELKVFKKLKICWNLKWN